MIKNSNNIVAEVKNSNLSTPGNVVPNATSTNNHATPTDEIGCSIFSLLVHNSLEDVAPLPIRLAAANDSKLTEHIIMDMAKQDGLCAACDYVVDSALFMSMTIAEQELNEEVKTSIEFIHAQLDKFKYHDKLSYLIVAADAIKELASKPGYTGLMNVALTALHTHYVF